MYYSYHSRETDVCNHRSTQLPCQVMMTKEIVRLNRHRSHRICIKQWEWRRRRELFRLMGILILEITWGVMTYDLNLRRTKHWISISWVEEVAWYFLGSITLQLISALTVVRSWSHGKFHYPSAHAMNSLSTNIPQYFGIGSDLIVALLHFYVLLINFVIINLGT